MIITRDLKLEDIPDIHRIIADNWNDKIAAHAVIEMEEMFFSASLWPPHYFVACDENKIVGCAGYKSAWLMANAYEFIWINIHKEYQKQGIGILLTEKRIEQVKKLGGTLILLMTQKQKFFEKFGFHRAGMFWSDNKETDNPWKLMTLQLANISL